jgi:hypothetical protein
LATGDQKAVEDISESPKEASKKSGRKPTIGSEVKRLVTNVSAIRLSLEEVLKALKSRAIESQKDVDAQLGGLTKKIPHLKKQKSVTLTIPFQKLPSVMATLRHDSVVQSSIKIVKEGHLLSLVSKWDDFFSRILRIIYDAKPQIISASERSLSFSEMSSLKSIDDARKMVIDMEIESVLRESHSEQFVYLEKKLGAKLREDEILWPRFIEITQRRNLVAHTGCRVSRQYLDLCKRNKVPLDSEMNLGSKFEISEEYIELSADCLIEIGIKLAQIVWNKIYPDDLENADRSYLDTTYQLIQSRQYALAAKLLSFFVSPPVKHAGERSKLMAIINLAQSYKWMGNDAECLKVLDEKDWSVLSDDFRLSDAVLRDKFDDASQIMERIGKAGVVKQEDYDGWPVFDQFRQSSQFAKVYRKLFGTQAEIVTTEDSPVDIRPSVAKAAKARVRSVKNVRKAGPMH